MSNELDNIEEIDNEEIDSLIEAQERHEEMLSVLRVIAKNVQQKDDKDLLDLLKKNENALGEFLNKLVELREIKIPETKVNINQEVVVKSINSMAKELNQNFIDLKQAISKNERPKEWEFTVTRNSYGEISSVKANAK